MKLLRTLSIICFGTFLFLGIPLISWGIRDAAVFFENPARLAYATLVPGLQVFSVLYFPGALNSRKKKKSASVSGKTDLVLIQILSLAIVITAPIADRLGTMVLGIGIPLRFTGLLFVAAGFVLMQAAEKHLADQFSVHVTVQEDHALVETGPYRKVRHPRYLGIILFFGGIAVVFRSGTALMMVTLFMLVLLRRVGMEEALMAKTFGEKWEAYCQRSWRLLPYIY